MFQPGTGTVVFGRYRLRREIARGSMGSVWMAQDQKLHRAVAVKLMVQLLHDSTEARLRFEREAMAVAQLQSPHVVQIYDYGIESGCPFIVMELLEGEDLRARLRRRKRLELDEARAVLVQACKALGVAHAAGIIHRDLKPANLFLVESRDEEIVKVLDFGVAKADPNGDIEQETTKQGALLGTPQYMSPEQARAEKVDHRSDLWSLGVIAFRMLTGQVPFQGKSLGDIIIGICTKPVPRATAFDSDLPVELDDFFERALARDPEQRFANARELAAAFSSIAPASYPSLSMPYSIGRPSVPFAAGSRPGAVPVAAPVSGPGREKLDLIADDYLEDGETRHVGEGAGSAGTASRPNSNAPLSGSPAGSLKPPVPRVGMAPPPAPPSRRPAGAGASPASVPPPLRRPDAADGARAGSRLPNVPLAPGVAQALAAPPGADSDPATLEPARRSASSLSQAAAALAAATALPRIPTPPPSGAGGRVVGVRVEADEDDGETHFMGDPRAAEELALADGRAAQRDAMFGAGAGPSDDASSSNEPPIAAIPTPLDAAYAAPAEAPGQAKGRRWVWAAAGLFAVLVVVIGVALGVGGTGSQARTAAAGSTTTTGTGGATRTPAPATTTTNVTTAGTSSAPAPASASSGVEPEASSAPATTATPPPIAVNAPPTVTTVRVPTTTVPPKTTSAPPPTAVSTPDPKPSGNPFDTRL